MNGRTHTITGAASVLGATCATLQFRHNISDLPAPLSNILTPPASLTMSLDKMTFVAAQVELPALSLTLLGLLLLGVVGGQFPDIDQPTSTIANSGRAVGRMMHQHGLLGFLVKVLFWIINFIPQTMAWIANNFFGGHRGVVHSLLAMLVVSGLVGTATYFLFGTAFYGTMFGVAYLTHLVADMFTRSGIKLLLPFSDHSFHLLPPGIRFKADSEWQNGLVQTLAMVAIVVSAWGLVTLLI